MFTPRGPLAGSFQHSLWPRGRVSETAILLSQAFAFVSSWYIVIIALSLCFSSGALQHTCPHINHSGQDSLTKNFFSRALIFRFGLETRSRKNISTNLVNTKCRLQTGYEMQTRYKIQNADRVQNADLVQNSECRPGTKCRLRIYTVWYVMGINVTA